MNMFMFSDDFGYLVSLKEGDSYSAGEFHKSLEMVSQQKSDIWVIRDFNYPKLDWDEDDVPFIRPCCTLTKMYEGFTFTEFWMTLTLCKWSENLLRASSNKF